MMLSNQGYSLRLRQTVPEDVPILLRAYEDESFIRLYRSNNAKLTEEQLTQILSDRAKQHPAKMGYIEFMIEHQQYGPIGLAAIGDYTPLHKRAEFLLGLFDQQHRSRGHGTEASLLMLDLAFNNYHLQKVYTYVYGYNDFAQKNTVKFGFKQEGCLENHHYSTREQRFVNLYINGMTEESFRQHEKIRRYALRLVGRDITQPYPVIKLTADNRLPIENGKKFIEGLQAMANQSASA